MPILQIETDMIEIRIWYVIWKQFNSVIILWLEELLSMFLIVFCHLLLAVFYIEFFCLFYSFHLLQLACAPPIKHWLQAHVFESRLSIPHHTWAWRHNLARRTAARLCRYSENFSPGRSPEGQRHLRASGPSLRRRELPWSESTQHSKSPTNENLRKFMRQRTLSPPPLLRQQVRTLAHSHASLRSAIPEEL